MASSSLYHLKHKLFLLLLLLIAGGGSSFADTYTIGWGTATEGNFTNFTSNKGSIEGIVSFSCAKNSSSGVPQYNENNKNLRLYYSDTGNGASITLVPAEGVTITRAVITSDTSPLMNYYVDGGGAQSKEAWKKTYTISGIAATSSLKIQNANTTNTQLQIKTIQLTYTVSATKSPIGSFSSIADQSVEIGESISFDPSDYFTKDEDATGDVSFSVTPTSGDLYYSGGRLYATDYGTQEFTITATPADADNDKYEAVETTFTLSCEEEVLDKGDITIVPSFASYTTVYGTALVGSVSVTDEDAVRDYDGTVTAESSNTAVATVAVEDGVVTITPVAAGTATITFSAAETTYFNAAADESIEVTVTAPAGKTTVDAENVVLYESFTGSDDYKYDNKYWIESSVTVSGGNIKVGTESYQGYAKTPQLGTAGDFTITFKAKAWSGDKVDGALVLSIEQGGGTLSQTSFNLLDSKWTNYSLTITGATANTKIQFSAAQASNNRFYLDDVRIFEPGVSSISGKLNASGYGTICSEYPLTFSEGDEFSAWQITSISGDVITFSQVEGGVRGGTGLFLKGRNGKTGAITINCENSDTALDDNLLVGTIVPTYVEANTYYGLSGSNFVKVAASTVPAGKALISAENIDDAGVKSFTLVFNETTGVSTNEMLPREQAEELFNLSGIRLAKPQPGINIIDGKKIVIK